MANLLDELEETMDDIGTIKAEFMSKITGEELEEFNSSQVPVDSINRKQVVELIESIPKPLVQSPFQPGASPTDEDNRFLCWNNVGIIRAQYGNDDRAIDVMFHDTERHSYVNFRNNSHFTFGSLSDDVVVVGSNGKHGTGPACLMGINLLEPDRDKREWEINLPHVELIEALAAGTGFVAVVTDQRFLRLYTNGSMQSYILSLPGQIVTISALDQHLMIVHHNGAGHSDDQNISMTTYFIDLFNNQIKRILNNNAVALSKRSPLAWASFSDEGSPCTYDYNGILRIFNQDLGWLPILNLRDLTSSALDHYFIVGVSEATQTARAVKCRRSRWPDFKTETADMVKFSLPMCDVETTKGKLEEELIRLRLAEFSFKRINYAEYMKTSKEAHEKHQANIILKLFALYLKDDREEMAKNLVFMMPMNHVTKLPEFAWKTKRKDYFIESLNRAIQERSESGSI